MGRNRVISEDQILDAAQHVVAKKGAAGLTIEAVATQAGISKASVLYLYKSKRALIKAVVDRMVSVDAAINEAAINDLDGDKDAAIRGRIRASSEGVTDGIRSIGLNLCASIANDKQLRRTGKDYMERTVERIKATCDHPKGAMLAFLALEGVKLLELVDWHTWTESERKRLLQDIEWLIDTDPQQSTAITKSALRRSGKTILQSPQAKTRKSSLGVPNTAAKAQDMKKGRLSDNSSTGKRKA